MFATLANFVLLRNEADLYIPFRPVASNNSVMEINIPGMSAGTFIETIRDFLTTILKAKKIDGLKPEYTANENAKNTSVKGTVFVCKQNFHHLLTVVLAIFVHRNH